MNREEAAGRSDNIGRLVCFATGHTRKSFYCLSLPMHAHSLFRGVGTSTL
jgi:hypothetical protein